MDRSIKRFDLPGRPLTPSNDPSIPVPQVELEIVRGRARHLTRPVLARAFLIGTATDCDLVLGDARFPEVHAYLLRGPSGVTVRWLGEGPELTVNGRTALLSAPLADKDLLRAGSYEFRVRIRWPQPKPEDADQLSERPGMEGAARSASSAAAREAQAKAAVVASLKLFGRSPIHAAAHVTLATAPRKVAR